MQRVSSILLSGGVGMISGAFFSLAAFMLLSLTEPTSLAETIGFGLIAGFFGGCVGLCIGLLVRFARVGPLGGALLGLAATALIVLGYVVVFGRPGRYLYFLRESAVIVLVFAVPAVASGILAALANRWSANT